MGQKWSKSQKQFSLPHIFENCTKLGLHKLQALGYWKGSQLNFQFSLTQHELQHSSLRVRYLSLKLCHAYINFKQNYFLDIPNIFWVGKSISFQPNSEPNNTLVNQVCTTQNVSLSSHDKIFGPIFWAVIGAW